MGKLSEHDLTKARLTLIKHLDEALTEMIEVGKINPGFYPDEVTSLMADSALNIIKTIAGVNEYIDKNEE